MKNLSTTVFQTGRQHTDLLCAATGIFALIFALPLLEIICQLPFVIWQQQNYPTEMLNNLIEIWIPISNILSAAGFALLSVMLLKAPKHTMILLAAATIAAAELINGIANLNIGLLQFQANSYQISMEVTAMDYFIPTWSVIQSVLTICCAILWLLPIAAHFNKKENSLFVLLPTVFFLLRILIGLFMGSMSETYYVSQFVQTAMIISLSILLLNNHQRPALHMIKKSR